MNTSFFDLEAGGRVLGVAFDTDMTYDESGVRKNLEATARLELAYTDLQSAA